jgi:hypothetical protein
MTGSVEPREHRVWQQNRRGDDVGIGSQRRERLGCRFGIAKADGDRAVERGRVRNRRQGPRHVPRVSTVSMGTSTANANTIEMVVATTPMPSASARAKVAEPSRQAGRHG